MATIEEALVPLYLHHRYQAEAAAKVVGGMSYTYALRGDRQDPLTPVPAAVQRAALDALLATLDPAELALPRPLLELIPPRPFTYGAHRELFDRWTGLGFDAVSPAASAADLTVGLLLNDERAARLVQQSALDPSLPGLDWTLGHLVRNTFGRRQADAYLAEIDRAVERVIVDHLMRLAGTAPMPQVRAVAAQHLMQIRSRYGFEHLPNSPEQAHGALLTADITRFLERDYVPEQRIAPPTLPPGAPIGDDGES